MNHHHDDEFRIYSKEFEDLHKKWDRRQFLTQTTLGLGALALGGLFGKNIPGASPSAIGSLEQDILAALPISHPKQKGWYTFL